MIQSWLTDSGLAVLKPALTALALPPVPWLALALVGAWRARRQRRGGVALVVFACAAIWLCCCEGFAQWLLADVLRPPPALAAADIAALKARAAAGERMAIVVLGGGVDRIAPEYGAADLRAPSLRRLRYGLWLGRRTGLPVAMSGGLGWSVPSGGAAPEADIGARIAAEEFEQPLRWTESASRDTRENAADSVALLGGQGVRTLVLVTQGWHMPRALREFRAAAARHSPALDVVPAPCGLAPSSNMPLLDWMPSSEGAEEVRVEVREALGLLLAP